MMIIDSMQANRIAFIFICISTSGHEQSAHAPASRSVLLIILANLNAHGTATAGGWPMASPPAGS